jgi:hypothetical protein
MMSDNTQFNVETHPNAETIPPRSWYQAHITELEAELKAWQKMVTLHDEDRNKQIKRAEQAEAAVVERDRMLMTLFMEERDSFSERGKDFFMPSDLWLADLRARAEEGGK